MLEQLLIGAAISCTSNVDEMQDKIAKDHIVNCLQNENIEDKNEQVEND